MCFLYLFFGYKISYLFSISIGNIFFLLRFILLEKGLNTSFSFLENTLLFDTSNDNIFILFINTNLKLNFIKFKTFFYKMSNLFSVFYLKDINSIIQSFLPGIQGKYWKDPDLAARAGHLHLLLAFAKKGKICTTIGMEFAIEYQHEHIFDYLCEQHIPCSSSFSLRYIALNGNTNILRKMLNMNAPFKTCHANIAASKGHINAVKLFYDNGIRCTHTGANLAAKEGYIFMLKYLYTEKNVKCNEYGFCITAKSNRPDVLKYLMDEQGLYGSSQITDTAIRNNCIEVANFMIERGIYATLEGWTTPLPSTFYTAID